MGGAAAIVDGNAVIQRADKAALAAQAGEQFLRHLGRSTIGTVKQHIQAGKICINVLLQSIHIVIHSGIQAVNAADLGTITDLDILAVFEDMSLNAVFYFIGQLVAIALENLDAVELHRVVGRGDHNTGVCAVFAHQIGHAGGGDHTQQVNVCANAAQTGSQGAFQHIAGNTGIFANQNTGTVAVQTGQLCGSCAADLQGQFTSQVFARHTADTIGTKQFTHIVKSFPSIKVNTLNYNE